MLGTNAMDLYKISESYKRSTLLWFRNVEENEWLQIDKEERWGRDTAGL